MHEGSKSLSPSSIDNYLVIDTCFVFSFNFTIVFVHRPSFRFSAGNRCICCISTLRHFCILTQQPFVGELSENHFLLLSLTRFLGHLANYCLEVWDFMIPSSFCPRGISKLILAFCVIWPFLCGVTRGISMRTEVLFMFRSFLLLSSI